MKQFKKALLSFVLIVCSVFLCACGSTPPPTAQIDSKASVNTSGTYTTATKEELTPYFDSEDDVNYIGKQEFTGLHTTMNVSAKLVTTEITVDDVYEIYLRWSIEAYRLEHGVEPEGEALETLEDDALTEAAAYMTEYGAMKDALAVLNNKDFVSMSMNTYQKIEDGFITAMASKSVEKMINEETFEMGAPIYSYEYFKDDVAYLDDGFTKYYLPKTDPNFSYVFEDLSFNSENAFGIFATGILEDMGAVVTKATEGTTVKFKAVVEGATAQDPDAQLVLVLKDGKFNGLQFKLPDFDLFAIMPELSFFTDMFKLMGLTIVANVDIDIVTFDGNIDFPSNLASKYNTLFDPSQLEPVE